MTKPLHCTPITVLLLVAVIFLFFCWTSAATLCQIASVVELRRLRHIMTDREVLNEGRELVMEEQSAARWLLCEKTAERETHLKSQPAEIRLTFSRRWESRPVSRMSGWITGGHGAEISDSSHQALLKHKCLYKCRVEQKTLSFHKNYYMAPFTFLAQIIISNVSLLNFILKSYKALNLVPSKKAVDLLNSLKCNKQVLNLIN